MNKKTEKQTISSASQRMPETGAQEPARLRKTSNAYNIFILVLTVLSLLVMVVMLLPLSEQTIKLLSTYDNIICIIFLIDFFLNLKGASKKSDYFIKGGGWLDLLGSIPSFGLTKYGGLLRLARLSRFSRITRLMRGENKKKLVADVVNNRSQYAAFVTILLSLIVLTVASVLVLEFESASPDAKIMTGADAFWYGVVTITTVGYGDYYPVTAGGRLTAMFIMFAGVGIIGVLASILSSVLVGSMPPKQEDEDISAAVLSPATQQDIADLKRELAAVRRLLEKNSHKGD
jgi:voltage-gated potassium channel